MMRADTFRAAAVAVVLVALLVAALASVNRRPSPPRDITVAPAPPAQDLSAELRRCNALGPEESVDRSEDAHCRAVWEENRRHFFGHTTQSGVTPAEPTRAAGPEARP